LTPQNFPRKLAAMPEAVAVHRREQQHGDGEEKPEPRQPVAQREKRNEICAEA
jgi:hypothetical protein